MERRKFLKYTSSTLAAPFLFQGQWMNVMAQGPTTDWLASYNPDRKLVLIQLNGGNDGLNMVIPISQYDNLVKARGNILVPQSQILKLTDETGFHPAMPELTNLYKDGLVKIIQGVGYPNPNLSHFRSKDILMSASDSNIIVNSGWLGRLFSEKHPDFPEGYPNSAMPHPIALTIGSASSAICQGELANYSSVLNSLSASYSNSAGNVSYPETPFGKELRYLSGMMEQTEGYLSVVKAAASKAKNLSTRYPAAGQNALADQLKIVANLIAGGLQTQIYVVNLGGWDTHSLQVGSLSDKSTGAHPLLMSKLSVAIAAFEDDLKLMKKSDEVIGFVYTEFGRRIKSNDSLGTDHGTTWPAIVFGSKINPGIIGKNAVIPSVVGKSDNLELQTDFRSIYASIYKQWFNINDQTIEGLLGKLFPEVALIANNSDVIADLPVKSLRIWPNPVEDNASISFTADGSLAQIVIYSMSGQQIESYSPQNYAEGYMQIRLELGHLHAGVYLLVIRRRKQSESVKFVVR